jgi:DNA-binding response OmpR family regulator
MSTILLIEDSPLDAELTMAALRRCGADNPVLHVSGGAEAIAFLDQDWPDDSRKNIGLILLDVRLPPVDGFEVLKHVRSVPDWESVPVVMLTTAPLEADRMRALLLGAASYMPKAMDLREFCYLLAMTIRPFLEALGGAVPRPTLH